MPPSTSIQANTGSPGGETVVSSQAFPAAFLHSCLLPRPLRIFNPRAHSFLLQDFLSQVSLFCRAHIHLHLGDISTSLYDLHVVPNTPFLHYIIFLVLSSTHSSFVSSLPPLPLQPGCESPSCPSILYTAPRSRFFFSALLNEALWFFAFLTLFILSTATNSPSIAIISRSARILHHDSLLLYLFSLYSPVPNPNLALRYSPQHTALRAHSSLLYSSFSASSPVLILTFLSACLIKHSLLGFASIFLFSGQGYKS